MPIATGAAIALGAGALGSAGASAYGSKRASDQAARGAEKGQAISAEAARRARLDNIALFTPALQDYARGVQESIDPLLQGRVNAGDILTRTTQNADQLLSGGGSAAQRAILGFSPQQTQAFQTFQSQGGPTGEAARRYGGFTAMQPGQQQGPGPVVQPSGLAEQAGGRFGEQMTPTSFSENTSIPVDPAEAQRWFPQLDPAQAQQAYSQMRFKDRFRYGPEGKYAGQLPSNEKKLARMQEDAIRATEDMPLSHYNTPLTQSIFPEGAQAPIQGFGGFDPNRPQEYTGTGLTGQLAAQQALRGGTTQGRADIAGGALGAVGTAAAGRGALGGAESRAMRALGFDSSGQLMAGGGIGGGGTYGLSQGMVDSSGVDRSIGAGISALEGAERRGLGEIRGGASAAAGELEQFAGAGEQALAREMALTGGAGMTAQQQALDEFIESPGQRYLRERQEQALLRNTAAIGGLGGGRVRTALQEQASGIAAQQQQQQIENLRSIAGRGQEAAGQQGGFRMQGGQAGGSLIGQMGQAQAGLRGQQAGIYGQMATSAASNQAANARLAAQLDYNRQATAAGMIQNMAGLGTGLYSQEMGVHTGAGQNLAGLAERGGMGISQLAQQGGTQLANILAGTAGQQAGLQTGLGGSLSGLDQQTAANLSNIYGGAGQGQANLRMGMGGTLGNITVGQGNQAANYANQAGQAQAAGTLGMFNAVGQGMGQLANIGGMMMGGGAPTGMAASGAGSSGGAGMPQMGWNPLMAGMF